MPALACVDAAPPRLAWEAPLPAPGTLLIPGGTRTPSAAAAADDGVWSVGMSAAVYNIDGWGAPYFFINAAGDVAVRPHGAGTLPGQEIDLMKVVRKATSSPRSGGLGLPLPLLVRFPDVLRHRLESLHGAFDGAIRAAGYGAHYQGVYPVKCNQDRHVVEDIVEFGAPFRFGLEAGSKPELLLAMSCLAARGSAGALLVCNGYKDDEYVSLALMARGMGLNTVIVLEQEEELDVIMAAAERLGVRPVIGFRAKLRTKHAGHFGATSGEKGKFGLTTTQILSVAAKLRHAGMLDCLQLLHFHIGSQIPSTALLADGVCEATQIYCELVRLGAKMCVLDIGGGLGIDYEGIHSDGSDLSVAYGLEEYADTVVTTVRRVCDARGVAHPVLCSESGRALVSHHSVLIFEAYSASAPGHADLSATSGITFYPEKLADEARADYCNLMTAFLQGDTDSSAMYADQLKRHCAEQFKEGSLALEQLAAVDSLCELIACRAPPVATYHVNLSLFTSMPDVWAISQLFPIMPLHRLAERPGVEAILSDLTCDSDGRVDRFIGSRTSLPLHELHGAGDRYYLGMFLGGAYQEALGGMHNLFGGPSVVRVKQSDGPHCFAVVRAVPGPSCADVLRAMHHEPELMFSVLKDRADGGLAAIAAISHAFASMPYLRFAGGGEGDSDGDGSDGATERAVDVVGVGSDEEDEELEMMRVLGF